LRHAAGAVAGRTLATPEPNWSLTSLKDKLIKMGAKVVSHGRYASSKMAEVIHPLASGLPASSENAYQREVLLRSSSACCGKL
jgi:hypothetical protein